VIIPGSVEEIGDRAFFNCKRLKIVTFNEGLKKIGKSAFANCEQIERLEIPDGVILGAECFAYQKNLKKLYLSSSSINKSRTTAGCFGWVNDSSEEVNRVIYIDGERLFAPSEYVSFFKGWNYKYRSRNFTAPTVEEALEMACNYWVCDKSKLSYKVMQEPKNTKFTKKDAKIEVEFFGRD